MIKKLFNTLFPEKQKETPIVKECDHTFSYSNGDGTTHDCHKCFIHCNKLTGSYKHAKSDVPKRLKCNGNIEYIDEWFYDIYSGYVYACQNHKEYATFKSPAFNKVREYVTFLYNDFQIDYLIKAEDIIDNIKNYGSLKSNDIYTILQPTRYFIYKFHDVMKDFDFIHENEYNLFKENIVDVLNVIIEYYKLDKSIGDHETFKLFATVLIDYEDLLTDEIKVENHYFDWLDQFKI